MKPTKCRGYQWALSAALVCLTLVFAGCAKTSPKPAHYIFVPDVSASIDPTARSQAFNAISVFVTRMNRGDTLTIIPITGDAEGEAQGQVLRLRVPTNREPYDQDLKRFQVAVRDQMVELEAQSDQKPGDRTDILGTVRLVNEEMGTYDKGDAVFVAILSDFIQDSRDFNFNTDSRLANDTGARALALHECHSDEYQLKTPVQLGHIKSKDWAKLTRERRHAIEQFWTACLTPSGGRARFVTDGLAAFNGN